MDGSHPAPRAAVSLPMRIDRLGALDPAWSGLAARSRALGLGLVMRGVQRGHPALLRVADPIERLALGCGAMGAGAVLSDDPEGCALLVTTDAALQERLRRRATMLALVGPRPGDRRERPMRLSIEEVVALGAAVDALDPGMWGECLAALRPNDAALRGMTHAGCAARLAAVPATPAAMAAALAALLGEER